MFHSVNYHNNQKRLTESPLLDFPGSKSEGINEFNNYLHQNICQGRRRRDLGIDTKSAEDVLEGHEKVNQCIVASTYFLDSLRELDVRDTQIGSEEEMHTVSKTPMPANIAFAGGNGCRIAIRDKVSMNILGRTTRPIASLRAEVMEGKHKMSTEELSAFMSFPSFSESLNSRKLCACS